MTLAKNCRVLSVPVERATNAYGGEISTLSGPTGPEIATIAFPLFDASARLVATSVTGFVAGTAAGARKSTLPLTGPAGAAHGFEPLKQTCPTTVLPFGTPFTVHLTAVSDVLATFAVNDLRWLTETVADPGETLTLTVLVTVTMALAVAVLPVASVPVA